MDSVGAWKNEGQIYCIGSKRHSITGIGIARIGEIVQVHATKSLLDEA